MAMVDTYPSTPSPFAYHNHPTADVHDNIASSPGTGASTPSLRAKHSVYIPMAQPLENRGNVKVVVRVRKFLPREISRGADCLVRMNPASQETQLLVPNSTDPANRNAFSRKVVETKSFTFDRSFWSHAPEDQHYAHQEEIYSSLGEEYLDHNFEGYHTCIFAYGQTGSGKSYTMMGTPEEPGLIPRTCQDLFERIHSDESPGASYSVRVSYFEVYNEHVRDLLVPRMERQVYLKIRESPTEGPYVKDLTDHPVTSYEDILRLIKSGDSSRTTASTKMNDTSSRSHAVFTITLRQILADLDTDETTERTSRIRLVDLAGSERAKATEATGQRLREGSNINKSLTTLGRVIAALADASASGSRPGSPKKRGAKPEVVPYRDSILTWLLKDSLGGNSKTAMIACISPSDYEETLSTLRYADQAKRIRTRAIVNQDLVSSAERDKQIQEMAEKIRMLEFSLAQQNAQEISVIDGLASSTQATAAKQHDAAMKRENEAQTMQLEEYRNQVQKMQRLMEETRQIGESKIQALRTENEALRLHLKLALDTLKNPVIVPEMKEPTNEAVEAEKMSGDQASGNSSEHEWDGDSDTDVDSNETDATEVHAAMQELLDDLKLFKRKLGDDHSRFIKDHSDPKETKMRSVTIMS